MQVAQWQGPPVDVMRAYNELLDNGAERLFKLGEDEAAHRRKIEERSQTFPLIDALAGRGCALVFGFACLLLAGYCVSLGAQVPATVFGGAMIVAGINAFMRRR